MLLKGIPNITLDEYIKIFEQVKSAALKDMEILSKEEQKSEEICQAILGLKLCYRDDEDCLYADSYMNYQLFIKFYPYLWEYITEESKSILDDNDMFDEPMKDKFYWEIIRYIQIHDKMYEQYTMHFSLQGDLISVRGNTLNFGSDRCCLSKEEKYLRDEYENFSDEQKFILSHADQLQSPLNVILPYEPGDILYIDTNPFGKPFYVVYCTETVMGSDYFEWTLGEYGHNKREHPCLYMSEDHEGMCLTELTGYQCSLSDVYFPYTPLDKIQVVDTCENPDLLKASRMLKENPDIFWKWFDLCEKHYSEGKGGWEKKIF